MSSTTGRAVLHRQRPPAPDELRRLMAARQLPQRTRWQHLEGVVVALIEGNAPERVLVRWEVAGLEPAHADMVELARLLSRVVRALPGARTLVDDPLALLTRQGTRFEVGRGARPEALPAGWRVRAGTVQHTGHVSAAPEPPATPGQLRDALSSLPVDGEHPTGIAARASLDPSLQLRELVRRGDGHTASALSLLTAAVSAGVLPPTGLPEVALRRLEDGDARERSAARKLLGAIGERVHDATRGPRVEQVGRTVRAAWDGMSTAQRPASSVQASGEDEDDLLLDLDPSLTDWRSPPGSRAWRALAAALPPPLTPHPRRLWPALPAPEERPRLGRRETLLQLLAPDDPSPTRTGALAMLATGCASVADAPGLLDRVVALTGGRSTLDASLACLALGRVPCPEASVVLQRVATEAVSGDVAGAAAEALAAQPGGEARHALRSAFERSSVAPAAATAAARIGDAGALPVVLEMVHSKARSCRLAAARSLPWLGNDSAVSGDLARLVSDPDKLVAQAALVSLAVVSDSETARHKVSSAPPDTRSAILAALGMHDRTELWDVLLAHLRHPAPIVRLGAAQGLGWLGIPAATPHLAARLDTDDDPGVQAAVCVALSRCGDLRAVPPLRRLAAQHSPAARAALHALRQGRWLRLPAAGPEVQLRALSPSALPLETAGRLTAALQTQGLRVRVSAAGVQGSARVRPDDLSGLHRVAQALNAAAGVVGELQWSVSDGQGLLRRHGDQWIVSAHRGRVAREAGWFDVAAPPPRARAPLSADPLATAGGRVAQGVPADLSTDLELDALLELDDADSDDVDLLPIDPDADTSLREDDDAGNTDGESILDDPSSGEQSLDTDDDIDLSDLESLH